MLTASKALENGILFVRNKLTNNLDSVTIPVPLQVGIKGYPGRLIVNGDLSLSSIDVLLPNNAPYKIPNSTTIINVKAKDSTPGTIYLNLPETPRNGQVIIIKAADGITSTNTISISSGSGAQIDNTPTKVLNVGYSCITLSWSEESNRWYTINSYPGDIITTDYITNYQFSAGSTVSSGAVRYLYPGFSTSAASNGSPLIPYVVINDNYLLTDLYITQEPAVATGINMNFIITKNGSDTAFSKLIDYNSNSAQNTSVSMSVVAGDKIGVKIVSDVSTILTPQYFNVSFLAKRVY